MCVIVSGVPYKGVIYTEEDLYEMVLNDDSIWTKTKPDGRVELWTNVRPVAEPLSSKEA